MAGAQHVLECFEHVVDEFAASIRADGEGDTEDADSLEQRTGCGKCSFVFNRNAVCPAGEAVDDDDDIPTVVAVCAGQLEDVD